MNNLEPRDTLGDLQKDFALRRTIGTMYADQKKLEEDLGPYYGQYLQ